ncbi:hypothetical protein Dimus_020090 [Dionaea muscipula]
MADKATIKSKGKKPAVKVFYKIEDARNHLDEKDLERMKYLFPCSDNFTYVLTSVTNNALVNGTENALAIFYHHFRHGVRFPLNSFLVKVLNAFSVLPGQIVANSTLLFMNFIVMLKDAGIQPI